MKDKKKGEKLEDVNICDECGGRVERNICIRCGTIYNPIQSMLAEKIMKEKKLYSVWLPGGVIFKDIDTQDLVYDGGLGYLQKMQLNEAIEFYERAVKDNPDSFTKWNNLGVAYMGLHNRKHALKCYEKAVELNGHYYIGLYNIGAVYFVCKKYEEAVKYYDLALKLNPKCGEAFWDKNLANEQLVGINIRFLRDMDKFNTLRAQMNRSSALVDLGEGDAVLGSFTLYLRHKRQLSDYFEQAKEQLDQGRTDQALKFLDKAIKLNPRDPKIWWLRSKVFLHLRDFEEALHCSEKLIQIDKNFLDGWFTRGIIYSTQHNSVQAIESFNQVLRINPFHKEAKEGKIIHLKGLYNSQKNKNDYEGALKALDQVLEEQPENASNWTEKGNVFFFIKDFNKAIECYNVALKFNPQSYYAWFNKGIIHLQHLGDFTVAFECFNEALKIKPNDKNALELQGVALEKSRENIT